VPGETVADATILEALGGKGANQAIAAARMGASVSLIACVGDDPAGASALETLGAEGVDTAGCRVVAEPTGRAAVLVDAAGQNAISVGPGANAFLTPGDVESGWPDRAVIVLTQLEIPVACVSMAIERAREQGAISCLNATPANRFAEVTSKPDILIVNRSEAEELSGGTGVAAALATALCARLGVGAVVVTDGARGAAACSGSVVLLARAPECLVRDSTGAGDAFAGALAALLAEGASLGSALRRACVAGALACTIAGAVPSLPRRPEVLGSSGAG
jgi:ribokinase